LSAIERVLLRLHLMMCERRINFARQIEFLRPASRKIPEVPEQVAD
jgi:hypothetical protein